MNPFDQSCISPSSLPISLPLLLFLLPWNSEDQQINRRLSFYSVQIVPTVNVDRRSSSGSRSVVVVASPNSNTSSSSSPSRALVFRDREPEAAPLKFDMDKPITTEPEAWDLVPPDGGWGWLVLAGSMLVNILIPGTIKSFGVLFVEFVEAFETTPAQVRISFC